jgi:DNA-binding NtrC family response regulator
MVANKLFRDDLYYRISAFPIRLPPLRERREDVPMLVESLLARSTSASGKPMRASDAAQAMLMSYDWPGNIRELRNVLERARLYADDGEIRPDHLNLDVVASPGPAAELRDDASFRDYVKRFKGSRKALASALGMSERSLYRRLKIAALD